MIDEIFEMIMKEARARPGKDFLRKLTIVFMEITDMVIKTQCVLLKTDRRQEDHED